MIFYTFAFAELTARYVICTLDTPKGFVSVDGKGYSQHGFTFTCAQCKFEITRENLAISKFAKDLTRNHLDPKVQKEWGNGIYLAYVTIISGLNFNLVCYH